MKKQKKKKTTVKVDGEVGAFKSRMDKLSANPIKKWTCIRVWKSTNIIFKRDLTQIQSRIGLVLKYGKAQILFRVNYIYLP